VAKIKAEIQGENSALRECFDLTGSIIKEGVDTAA